MKNRYLFPAIFSYEEDGINISFPDLPACFSCGFNDEEALKNAKEVLELYLFSLEEDGLEIPDYTPVNQIKTQENEAVMLIDVWMIPVRDQMKNKSIRKNCTIPAWLNDIAEENKVNFSMILQSALKEYLGIERNTKL